jgi:hypothetical protein
MMKKNWFMREKVKNKDDKSEGVYIINNEYQMLKLEESVISTSKLPYKE